LRGIRKRVELFAENFRDGFRFEVIELEIHPDDKDRYRILDGAHRFKAHRAAGPKQQRQHFY